MNIEESNSVVPKNIKRVINEKGIKKYVVAKKAGYTAVKFSKMLNGEMLIRPCDVIMIAKVLEVEIGELFKEVSG